MFFRTNNSKPGWLFAALWGAALTLIVSCAKTTQPNKGSDAKDAQSATLDLQAVRDKYKNAEHYADQAKVILHYSLNGAPFEEIHPCSLAVTRNGNMRFHRFKMELVADQSVALARVLDPDSQNFGGQVVGRKSSPTDLWNQILKDAIGYHFANGADDIPWSDHHDRHELFDLLNIPYLLFSDSPPEWFSQPCLVEAKVVEAEGKRYQDAVFNSPFGKIACRFDDEENLLLGIRFPRAVLSDAIASSPGIANVSLAIIFESASFEECQPKPPRLDPHELPLKKFVRLPEEFPSQTIGKSLESWGLVVENNTPFDPASLRGAPAVLFYGPPEQYRLAELNEIQQLTKRLPFAKFAWASPINIPQFPGNLRLPGFLRLADSDGSLFKNVGMNKTAFLLILDKNGVIQFAASRDKNWLTEVAPVIERIRNGDNVAQEMHDEYSKYFSEYQSAINSAQAEPAVKDLLLKN